MTTQHRVAFLASDVPRAERALDTIPYLQAVASLINGGPRASLFELQEMIGNNERYLPEAVKELDAPLPGWMEESRRLGNTVFADRELARRRSALRECEAKLSTLRQQRSQRLATLEKRSRVEACSRSHGTLVAGVTFHPLIAALHFAFNDHRPICLSPDMIWLLLAQGVATHLNANAEMLRPRCVTHEGKKELEIRRDDFIKGAPENPWPEVFAAFTDQIRGHVGETTFDLFMARYSTTGPVEQAAFAVALMDAMQSYFDYCLATICGIPEVELEGTVDDWRLLRARLRELGRFGLAGWARVLEPILAHFVSAADGAPDPAFWRSIYRFQSSSGGSFVTGWVLAFFPYLQDLRSGRTAVPVLQLLDGQSEWLGEAVQQAASFAAGQQSPSEHEHWWSKAGTLFPGIDAFPQGLSSAPMRWRFPRLNLEYSMRLLAGFVGVGQNPDTLTLRPEIGWAVQEATQE